MKCPAGKFLETGSRLVVTRGCGREKGITEEIPQNPLFGVGSGLRQRAWD